MKRAYLAITALLVGPGCASPPVEYVPFRVEIPVEVPCAAELPPEPEWAAKVIPEMIVKCGEIRDAEKRYECIVTGAVDPLLAERRQRKGYEDKLKAATAGCQ